MSPRARAKLRTLAVLEPAAADLEGAAREVAIAMITVVGVDAGGDVLIGPVRAITRGRAVLGLHLPFGRPGRVAILNAVPGTLDISTAQARQRFWHAVVAALERSCRVHAYGTFGEFIAAARAPAAAGGEAPRLH
jgi:hypothetical protein